MFYYYVDKDFEYAEKTQFKLHNVLLLYNINTSLDGYWTFKIHNVLLLFMK